jgi:hypothetical protein
MQKTELPAIAGSFLIKSLLLLPAHNFTDLADGRDIGKIGDVGAQGATRGRDPFGVPIGRVEIETSDTNVGSGLTTPVGDALEYFHPDKAKRLKIPVHKIHVFGSIIRHVEPGRFLVGVHNTDFEHLGLLSTDSTLLPSAWRSRYRRAIELASL